MEDAYLHSYTQPKDFPVFILTEQNIWGAKGSNTLGDEYTLFTLISAWEGGMRPARIQH